MIAVGQIAELELKDIVVPYQRRSESGAETEKKQTTVNMAAERLHCGIVNDARRLPQEPRKIESSPTFAKMFRILHNFTTANRRRKSDRDGREFQIRCRFVKSPHEIARRHVGARVKFQFIPWRRHEFDLGPTDIDEKNVVFHRPCPQPLPTRPSQACAGTALE